MNGPHTTRTIYDKQMTHQDQTLTLKTPKESPKKTNPQRKRHRQTDEKRYEELLKTSLFIVHNELFVCKITLNN